MKEIKLQWQRECLKEAGNIKKHPVREENRVSDKGVVNMLADVKDSTINVILDRKDVMDNLEAVEEELLWLLSILRECKETLDGSN